MPAARVAQHSQGLLGTRRGDVSAVGETVLNPASPPRHSPGIPQALANLPSSNIPSALLPWGFTHPPPRFGPAGSMCRANPAPAAVPGPHGTGRQKGGCTGSDQRGGKLANDSSPLLKSQGSPRAFPALLASHNSLDILHRPLTLHLNHPSSYHLGGFHIIYVSFRS